MKIVLACDHGGYELKMDIIAHLKERGIEVLDLGTNNGTDSVDYPKYGEAAANAVVSGEADCGIVVCGTGIGISYAANKVPGIRCAVLTDTFSARMTKAHNNSNMIALGGRVVGKGLALDIVDAYLDTEFEGGRHQKRIDLLTEIEKKHSK
ncbi:ribose 5-phosphate isomerase B [Peptacetobacter hominis]|uniref:Ribose 5-phosphate isomerase B n=1 Tax=Peptacetobacter hominis TaxID=2743610 RepID=A0A544QTG8_9FIRM|nr:ribose 5-phosphate isomerase B [Peptacetobacter hominis]TQQ83989.1 ribose 5-phosphate isomerase B [Peptacetobacter hominis]